jgi:hypothetical protein
MCFIKSKAKVQRYTTELRRNLALLASYMIERRHSADATLTNKVTNTRTIHEDTQLTWRTT